MAYRLIPGLSIALLAFLLTVFVVALVEHLQVMQRWLERPSLLAFPALGAAGRCCGAKSVRRRRDALPYAMVMVIFAAAFGTLAIAFWPYMIPFSITIEDAAAPHATLAFMSVQQSPQP